MERRASSSSSSASALLRFPRLRTAWMVVGSALLLGGLSFYLWRKTRLWREVLLFKRDINRRLQQERQQRKARGEAPCFRDMLLGVAVGDAFGAGIEFKSREWILENVDFSRYLNERKGSWGEGFSAGMWTDDTEMTIGTMKAMMECEILNSEILLTYWLNEYKLSEYRNGVPRQGHGGIRNFFTGGCTIEELRQQNREKEYPGNAPPMRAIPLAFIQDDPQRQFHYALLNADATHPHPKARVASYLIVKAAEYMIIKREEPRGIIDYCLASCGVEKIDEETYDYLREVNQLEDYHVLEERSRNRERRRRERMEKRKDRDEEDYEEDEEEECGIDYELLCGPQPIPTYNINGVGPDSMRTAGCVLYILKFYRSPMDTLRIAIQMGGDVDSLASICLGIVGGRYGLTGLPSWMFDQLEAKDELIALAKRFEEFVAEAESCVLP
ncbi:ADPribosylglycohydrolase superfamily protein [Balamuthia mandrillaris]